ncbi:50S ribosomal protein L6 [Candidatus Woesearchaeota archaeon CG10_big_fil_rev_8_21_14_0_10_37_12]|nr:MAG: 50S ribosomal protein L6 [Candidatus Woesearchaeota archaeon CG10_big_fil_rev_8_21_14_0_10_37_12]
MMLHEKKDLEADYSHIVTKKMKEDITEIIQVPSEVTATITNQEVNVKGKEGELSYMLNTPKIKAALANGTITLSVKQATKREKRTINAIRAHIRNMINGVQKPYTYKLKICSGHFPMNVSINENTLFIKNFLGEKSPRTTTIHDGKSVKIEGDQITVQNPSKELAGKIASNIELLTNKGKRDTRTFQDGIYITEKAGKPVRKK